MRFVPIDKLPSEYDRLNGTGSFKKWCANAEIHLENIRNLSPRERSTYWSKHSIWTDLIPALSSLSGNKCWYSEAPESSSEWEIDHFRPKAQSKKENGFVIREDGYWWLSYHWKNFRLAGSLINKLRRDKFEKNKDDVLGKGNFFPLESDSQIAKVGDLYCSCERPILLDPTSARDCSLLSFDETGDIFPCYSSAEDERNYERAKTSITHYGLNHTPLKRGRANIWQTCERLIDETNNFLKVYIDQTQEKEKRIRNCFSKLVEFTDKNAPYSMVAKNFLSIKSKQLKWLEEIVKVM